MTEPSLHAIASWAMIAAGALTALGLRFITAPYGRHARGGWGPSIPSRVGWVLMEAPASLVFLAIYLVGRHRFEAVPLALLAVWQAHYVHRTFVFPFRMRLDGRTMPVSIAIMSSVFNLWNAYINARWISHLGAYPTSWLVDPRFVIGVALFVTGMVINLRADYALMRLRKPGETGYKIPRGGLFEYVACPNYLGEIMEWCGWAIATWSLPGLAFAVYTAANVGPRAGSHLAWYREKFPEYPGERKALIPFVW